MDPSLYYNPYVLPASAMYRPPGSTSSSAFSPSSIPSSLPFTGGGSQASPTPTHSVFAHHAAASAAAAAAAHSHWQHQQQQHQQQHHLLHPHAQVYPSSYHPTLAALSPSHSSLTAPQSTAATFSSPPSNSSASLPPGLQVPSSPSPHSSPSESTLPSASPSTSSATPSSSSSALSTAPVPAKALTKPFKPSFTRPDGSPSLSHPTPALVSSASVGGTSTSFTSQDRGGGEQPLKPRPLSSALSTTTSTPSASTSSSRKSPSTPVESELNPSPSPAPSSLDPRKRRPNDDAVPLPLKRHDAKRQYLALKERYEELNAAVHTQLKGDLEKSRQVEATLQRKKNQLLEQLWEYEGRRLYPTQEGVGGEEGSGSGGPVGGSSRTGRWTRCSQKRGNGEVCNNPMPVKRGTIPTSCGLHSVKVEDTKVKGEGPST